MSKFCFFKESLNVGRKTEYFNDNKVQIFSIDLSAYLAKTCLAQFLKSYK